MLADGPLIVLHVSPYFYPAEIYGGPIQSVLRLCDSTIQLGHTVRVATTDANGPASVLHVDTRREVALEDGLRIRYFRRIGRHSAAPGMVGPLFSAIAASDVVHLTAVYSFTTFPTLAYCRLLDKPMVWSPRGSFQRWAGSTRTRAKAAWEDICRVLAPRRLRVHTTSEEEARVTANRLRWLRVSMIPNGVDIPPARIRAFRPDGVLRLLYLGRLHPIKALDRLLDACRLVTASGELRWSLVIAGDGTSEYTQELRARVDALDLGGHIQFSGHVSGEQKEAILDATDVLVLPSHVENFGLVVAEGLARGIPVIASRGTPWRRAEEVGAGLWVDNSPNGLAQAITAMATRPLACMGAAGRAWVESEFSWPSVARHMVELYRSTIASVPAA